MITIDFLGEHMKKRTKKGFTLTELVVVLVIMAIIAAIAVPFFMNYWRKAEFRKNEENAKTVYLAAESRLTYYRTSGQWNTFKKKVKSQGIQGGFSDSEKNNRIYAITLDAKAYAKENKKTNAVIELLDDYTYDKDIFNGAIGIEIDIKSGEVYSAFYGTKCKGLNYAADDNDGYLTMKKRDYESRQKRLLGYYSTEDTVNVVNLKPTRLRITSINLVNSEKLSLDWSSNVGANEEVDYTVDFYEKSNNKKLFTLRVSPYDMQCKGWSGDEKKSSYFAELDVKDESQKSQSGWKFPVTYDAGNKKFSLVLDAMMSAKVQASLEKASKAAGENLLEKSSSTNITRLKKISEAMANPVNVYAKVKATSYTGTGNLIVNQEFRNSEEAESNEANTMYGDKTKGKYVQITAFRHLSNMRYYNKDESTTFKLDNKNMDWTSVGTGLYDFKKDTLTDGKTVEKLSWKENSKTNTIGFPSIKELPEKYTLSGEGDKTQVSNLYLTEESVIDDETAKNLETAETEYLGLFSEARGTIEKVTFKNPSVEIGQKKDTNTAAQCQNLKGIGILTGRLDGKITDVKITVANSSKNTNQSDQATKADENYIVKVTMPKSDTKTTLGVGAITGVFAGKSETDNNLTMSSGLISGVTVSGKVQANLPVGEGVDGYKYGIGGVAGYAKLSEASNAGGKISGSKNHADVFGNLCTGGIVGNLEGSFQYNSDETYDAARLEAKANVQDCYSDGLILCTSEEKDSSTMEGNYFGGVAGYAEQALLYKASSASGRAGNFKYTDYVDRKDTILLGEYVGGIAGYGKHTLLSNCSTEKNGYVLGSEYVGGIAGGLGGGISEAIQAKSDTGASVTTNASYVIGNSYVGGIVGKNEKNAQDKEGVTLKNCINNGVAAGYEKYVGGIAGYNENGCKIADCASYLSDYDSSIYNMIVKNWKATADYAGGIAGYNDGDITFAKDSEAITVKSVSSIVVGQNYIGGIAGFNDVNGSLDVHYTLIGGRIYGYGDCVGGGFGFNASTKLLGQELIIKPSSIEGQNYVGGIIGANVVNLSKNTTMSSFRTENLLGTISGDTYVGGIIGYQRTYGSDQLAADPATGSIRAAVEGSENLLPGVDENHIPEGAFTSDNAYKLTISTKDNGSTGGLAVATNNIPLRANAYVGGIVGYCEKNSPMVIKNCKNTGNISIQGTNRPVQMKAFVSKEVGTELSGNIANPNLHLIGGIISANLENQVIDNCTNTGSMSGYSGTGGIVGLNAGLVINCKMTEHFGNASLSYIGGIAGINVGQGKTISYGTNSTNGKTYAAGTIEKCSTASGKNVSGKNNVGGIVGWNLPNGTLTDNKSYANITSSGNSVGGVAGRNSGNITLSSDAENHKQNIYSSGSEVGGLVGVNEGDGSLQVATGTLSEVVAVGTGTTINGYEKVGGIVGANYGQLGNATQNTYLTCKAERVRASHGTVGGIVGETSGNISKAINNSGLVTADAGTAGGITATNAEGKVISDCKNYGNVTSNNGYAGGITATNSGEINNCVVGNAKNKTNTTTIYSLGTDELGGVTAINSGTIAASYIVGSVTLQGDATKYGGITGRNDNTVQACVLETAPNIVSTKSDLTVGGAVGENLAMVTGITTQASGTVAGPDFNNFSKYKYLGGIVGTNGNIGNNTAVVNDSTFSGRMKEQSGEAGNCYGGIAGINFASLTNDSVETLTMDITGVYTATSTSTEAQKEASATHTGGITGKNETTGLVQKCTLKDNSNSSLRSDNGMLGGVTGFNKGTIELSGSNLTADIFDEQPENNPVTGKVSQLANRADESGMTADSTYVRTSGTEIENMYYNGGGTATGTGGSRKKVSEGKLKISVETNGNLGGIIAYNGTTGSVTGCVSGNWFLVNKSQAIGVGTGGVIGMNESEKDLNGLINGAFVGRQLGGTGVTNRFAGGIIGNQNNSSSSNWIINNCINYGTIYCFNTHYSGGIMGQWTGSGGTIENSRNYGNLQTTYAEGWVGASGGIVAQLYHAYEENEYNIIGCSNYGSIYTKSGGNTSDGANDSAGILGNITTYYVSNESQGQKFKVQVLDCVNEAGVKIYSASMASGVVGFVSSDPEPGQDKTGQTPIDKSTQNIEMRIERCQNYAEELKGAQFTAGIFGDRYGATGARNTTISDCYSLNRENQYYAPNNSPIFSFRNGNASPGEIKKENRKNNYFIQGNGQWNGWKSDAVKLDHKKNIDRTNHNDYHNDLGEDGFSGDHAKTQYAQYEVLLTDIDKDGQTRFFIAGIEPKETVNDQYAYITDNGYILSKDKDALVGQVLFYLDESYNANGGYYKVWDKMLAKGSNYSQLARESYRRIEGIEKSEETGKSKILSPSSVDAEVKNGKITVNVTPRDLPGSLKNEKCDPFKYNVEVSDGNATETFTIYNEEGSFNIPSDMSGMLNIKVQAVSMFDDVEPSDWVSATTKQIGGVLPAPDVRVELIKKGTGHAYRFVLKNIDEYQQYSGWKVEVGTLGGNKVTLNATNPTQSITLNSGGVYQMTAQATINGDYENSSSVSTPVYLPAYKPTIALKGGKSSATSGVSGEKADPSVSLSGDTLEKLSVNIKLDGSGQSKIVENPPVYRAELIGTWNGQSDVIFAHTDMLTVAQGVVNASFTNLPEYISKVNDLKVRIWYEASGLGPVYTYYDVNKGTEANVAMLESIEDGNEIWSYQHSTVLESSSYFDNYIYKSSKNVITWLPAPVLDQKNGSSLVPEINVTTGELRYTFSWDKDVKNGKYEIAMTGIDESGKTVTIDTSGFDGSNSFTIDGQSWTYKQVQLKVTRIGDASKGEIGLSTTATYNVSQRLEQPSQPIVTNVDQNELDYDMTWTPISSEEHCIGYRAYIQTYEGETLGRAEELGSLVTTSEQKDGSYTERVNLEKYAGKRAVIYLVAKADTSGEYLDSPNGITYELEIPERLAKPNVIWQTNWTYDKNQFVTADAFANGGLTVSLTADANSIPPGGSAYLLKAYIYDSADKANAATETDAGDSIDNYPAADVGTVVQMDANSSTDYSHAMQNLQIKYAGKWIVFYARISSGGGNISSKWTKSDSYRLPYVKLNAPEVTSEEEDVTLQAKVTETPDVPGELQEWTAKRTTLSWNSVSCADLFEIALAGKVTKADSQTEKDDVTANIRTIEKVDADNKKTLEVQEYVQQQKADSDELEWVWKTVAEEAQEIPDGTPETDIHHKFILDSYKVDISSNYTAATGGSVYYELTLNTELDAVIQEDGTWHYTLKLPDVTEVMTPQTDTQAAVEVTHEDFQITNSASFKSNVTNNLDSTGSDAYVESDANEIKWTH